MEYTLLAQSCSKNKCKIHIMIKITGTNKQNEQLINLFYKLFSLL